MKSQLRYRQRSTTEWDKNTPVAKIKQLNQGDKKNLWESIDVDLEAQFRYQTQLFGWWKMQQLNTWMVPG